MMGFPFLKALFPKKTVPPYRYFISLGRNCEPAFRFHEYHGWLDSTLFTYCAFMDPLRLPDALSHLDLIFKGAITPLSGVNMFKCENMKVSFHGRRKYEELKTKEDIMAEKAECQSRIFHLVEKTEQLLKKPDRKLFVLTVWKTTPAAWEMVKETREILSQKTDNFTLVVVVSKSENKGRWQETEMLPELKIRRLTHFSPFDNVKSLQLTDKKGWQRIWQEFPVLSPVSSHKN